MKDMVVQTASLAEMMGHSSTRRLLSLNEFIEQVHSEISRARRFKLRIALLLVSAQEFNRYSEECGEEWWESAMSDSGKMIIGCLRESDVVGRYAIDAFAVLLTHTDLRDAPIVARKICDRVSNLPLMNKAQSVRLSVCIGMSQFPDVECQSAMEFVKQAEASLCAAEQQGPGTVMEGGIG